MAYYRVGVNQWTALVPVFFLLLVLFTLGVTLITSALNVFYRDVNPVVQIALQLWLYLTPVAYPLSAVERYRTLFLLNPLTGVVEGLRSVVVFGREPEWSVVAVSASLIVGIFLIGLLLFKRTDKYFADVI
jgi:lipopolysaccharide transport system permease protein